MTTQMTILGALLCLAIPCSGFMVGEPPILGKYKQDAKELNEWIQFQELLSRAVIPELVFHDASFEDALETIQAECHKRMVGMVGEPPILGEYKQDAKELNEWIQFQERLSRAVIPELVFHDASFEDALKTIQAECHKRAEMNFEIVFDPETWKPEPLTLRLRNLSAAEILRILAGVTGYGFRFRNESLVVSPAGDYVIECVWKVEADLAHLLDHLPDKFSDDKPLGAFVFNRSKALLTFREDQKKVDHANEILRALGIAEPFISSNKSVENLAP
jgi:hypothetical protein